MSSDSEQPGPDPATLALIEQLQETGFFEQIRALDGNIKKIVTDLETLGGLATQRVQETENLAAHVLAVEAILAAILKSHPIDPEAVQAALAEMTAESNGDWRGNPAVQSVVRTLLPSGDDGDES